VPLSFALSSWFSLKSPRALYPRCQSTVWIRGFSQSFFNFAILYGSLIGSFLYFCNLRCWMIFCCFLFLWDFSFFLRSFKLKMEKVLWRKKNWEAIKMYGFEVIFLGNVSNQRSFLFSFNFFNLLNYFQFFNLFKNILKNDIKNFNNKMTKKLNLKKNQSFNPNFRLSNFKPIQHKSQFPLHSSFILIFLKRNK
jgi:hypothetical protein